MPKGILIKPLSYTHAWAIVVKGKKAKDSVSNPYRRFTTQWYCWGVGNANTGYSAAELVQHMQRLGYPIGGSKCQTRL